MDGLLDLFECVIDSPRHGEYIQEFLKSCTEHQAFYKKQSRAVQHFVSFTNSKLNKPSDRLEGLLLLQTFLPQCSDQLFLENAVSWIHQCVKGIKSSKCSQTNYVAFSVLKLLLEMANNFQELTKNIANIINTKFMDQLKNAQKNTQVEMSALHCIQTLVRNYGAACTSQKATIENFVLPVVDRKDPCIISAASRCFALLPLIGGAGSFGTNHKTRWLEQQRRTCGTLQLLLDKLLDGLDEVEVFERNEASEILPLEPLTDVNPIIRIHEITNRFENVSKFLEAMLLNEFPVSKSVLPDIILGIVGRGLSINCSNLGNKGSSDLLTVGSVLPRINVAVLRVLNALILCIGKNLFPQAKLICRLVLQTLKWTTSSSQEYGICRPFSSVRIAACRTLVTWLRVAKAGSCVEVVADELVQALSQDVSTEKAAVKLNVLGSKKSKKRKHYVTNDEIPSTSQPTPGIDISTRIKLTNQTANDKTCEAALDVLYWMVLAAGIMIKPSLHKTLQETVLLVLYDLQRSNRNDLPIPYSEVKCRLSLYRLLQVLTLEPHPMWPPPTQFTLHILAQGLTDPSSEVSGFCSVALSSVEKLIHSSSQALQYPLSLEEVLKGVNVDRTSTVCPITLEMPVDNMDAESMASISNVGSPPPRFSPVLGGREATADLAPQINALPSETNDEDLSDASTVQYPSLAGMKQMKQNETLGAVVEEPKQNNLITNKLQSSNTEDKSPGGNASKKRKAVDEDSELNDSSTKGVDVHCEPKLLHKTDKTEDDSRVKVVDLGDLPEASKIPDETIDSRVDVVDLGNLPEINKIPDENTSEQKTDTVQIISETSTNTKVFQGKFAGVVSPKLLGGGEVSKVTRFNLKPRFVNLADDEDGSIVNLSSDEEFHESNISVVSSNSNYQESILNKSGITNEGDLFEDLEEECEETILTVHHKHQENTNSDVCVILDKTSTVSHKTHEEIVLLKSNGIDCANTYNLETNVIDVEEVVNINGMPRASESAAERRDVKNTSQDDDICVESEEPVVKKLRTDSNTDGTVGTDSTTLANNFEAMTDEEVVRLVFDDFKQKLDT